MCFFFILIKLINITKKILTKPVKNETEKKIKKENKSVNQMIKKENKIKSSVKYNQKTGIVSYIGEAIKTIDSHLTITIKLREKNDKYNDFIQEGKSSCR